ncbi:MAG: hypothetical protein OEV63_12300 [Gammaproteobacteria bacterium]|nr:hypothetical protein [Gammaproteobacteria bacterium]
MTNRRKRCAFLTMQDTSGWSIDADLAFAPLAKLGWHCEWKPWREPGVDWSRFDAVYIAAPWDYPTDPAGFLKVLAEIDASGVVLVNDLSLVRWNLAKTYLRDLESRGASIVPSRWCEESTGRWFDDGGLDEGFATFGNDIIVKPIVSTNATDTFLLSKPVDAATLKQLKKTFAERPFVVQPFVASIRTEGEISLFYFGDRYSHAIQKIPKSSDFRVQEEHGAEIFAIEPESSLRETADLVISLVDPLPVYCRSDFVRGADGRFLVMELEMIEPSMYLRMHDAAPQRFAEALDRYVRRQSLMR